MYLRKHFSLARGWVICILPWQKLEKFGVTGLDGFVEFVLAVAEAFADSLLGESEQGRMSTNLMSIGLELYRPKRRGGGIVVRLRGLGIREWLPMVLSRSNNVDIRVFDNTSFDVVG